jgi:hypothetical protein
MKLYLYTLPKAGTYFMAELIGQLGYRNTGYHVERLRYLDTHSLDAKTNREFPLAARTDVACFDLLRTLADGDFAFGHYEAAAFPDVLTDFKFICMYRHPREVLVSEFIDFRFRRKGVPWALPSAIPDDVEAFAEYMRRHARHPQKILSKMLGVQSRVLDPLVPSHDPKRYLFLNFSDVMKRPEAPLRQLATFLEVDEVKVREAYQAALDAETKTKATDIRIDRASLWSHAAEVEYARLNFYGLASDAYRFGWTFDPPGPPPPKYSGLLRPLNWFKR